jgi:cytochrome c-type biogenesis protein CcmH/NrfF
MKSSRQPSAVSRRALRWRILGCLLGLALVLPLTGATPDRFGTLGHRLMCSCGCGQVLLECNHVGCPRSDGMRNELSAGIQRGDSDDLVLQSFVQKYGATILAAPTATGFNRVAWVMPFAALVFGLLTAIFFIRRWGSRRSGDKSAVAAHSPYQEQVRRETEL